MSKPMFETLESRQLFSAGGTGLQGVYYNNQNFTGTQVARVDPMVTFNFGTKSPIANIAASTYSIRWFGQIKPAYTENYTFKIASDDGVRLWVKK